MLAMVLSALVSDGVILLYYGVLTGLLIGLRRRYWYGNTIATLILTWLFLVGLPLIVIFLL